MFEVHALSRRYGSLWALREASFAARPGEVHGLIGPNGSGKSTLLECAAGLQPRESGEVRWQGRSLRDPREAVVCLPDHVHPWEAQPLRWLLAWGAELFRGPLRDDLQASLGLEPFLDKPLGTLSKGQRKRALLAFVLQAPRPVVLLDEPFDGLDLRQARDLAALLKAEAARGRVLVLSIHQLVEAERTCDRMTLIQEGRILASGSLAELEAEAGVRSLEEVFLARA